MCYYRQKCKENTTKTTTYHCGALIQPIHNFVGALVAERVANDADALTLPLRISHCVVGVQVGVADPPRAIVLLVEVDPPLNDRLCVDVPAEAPGAVGEFALLAVQHQVLPVRVDGRTAGGHREQALPLLRLRQLRPLLGDGHRRRRAKVQLVDRTVGPLLHGLAVQQPDLQVAGDHGDVLREAANAEDGLLLHLITFAYQLAGVALKRNGDDDEVLN